MRPRLLALASALGLAAAAVGPRSAMAGRAVDINTLTPVPPPPYACKAVGSANATICTLTVTSGTDPDTGNPFADCYAGTGHEFLVLEGDTGRHSATRLYDGSGLIYERIFHDDAQGSLINALTGKSIPVQ